jgi:hypothetical protein
MSLRPASKTALLSGDLIDAYRLGSPFSDSARRTLSRPPMKWSVAMWSAEYSIMWRTVDAASPGFLDRISPASPAAYGAEKEVPPVRT